MKIYRAAVWLSLVLGGFVWADDEVSTYDWVNRHNVEINEPDPFASLSVGNGHFCFTVDVTGLQTFGDYYRGGIPLTTMADWGWHSFPNGGGYKLSDTFEMVDTYGRQVSYNRKQSNPSGAYLRANPHQSSLVQVRFVDRSSGSVLAMDDISNVDQQLNLWQGVIYSRFKYKGKDVTVETVCDPGSDAIACKVSSELLGDMLAIEIEFPYANGKWGADPADFGNTDKHTTETIKSAGTVLFKRKMDGLDYTGRLSYKGAFGQAGKHKYSLTAGSEERLEFVLGFDEKAGDGFGESDFDKVKGRSVSSWQERWNKSMAIDLSGSKDSRWFELERRIVLSRYLMLIQNEQRYPAQETGLTCNSWFGKFHLEMHWWHQVHFAYWGECEPLRKSMGYYKDIMPAARAIARRQGYKGVRWPKMTGPAGEDSPSGIGSVLIWQQPHPIFYAELLYEENPTAATVDEYKDIVFETAEFMVDFAHWDEVGKRYVLGPPVIPAQEEYDYKMTMNPAFELCYWQWGLETAQKWRKLAGLEPDKKWQDVIDNLSELPVRDGVYQAIETEPYTVITDHPSMLASYGFLPATELVDVDTMKRTVQYVYDEWSWPDTWGWDYPMLAMSAARCGMPEMAVDAFFIDSKKNLYLPNGHNYQRENLPLYLPGNGGLLAAVAMMANGWDEESSGRHAPGFPDDGGWVVKVKKVQK